MKATPNTSVSKDDGTKHSIDQQLQEATDRAEAAEKELDLLKNPQSTEPLRSAAADDSVTGTELSDRGPDKDDIGIDELRKDSMMAHLIESLEAGTDIGHYGRLVFAMVARHFISVEEVVTWLQRDTDFDSQAATTLLSQVEGHDYNPPKREKILKWQHEQSFQIIPDPADPDCGSVYKNLKFPDSVYGHIEEYQEEKVAAG